MAATGIKHEALSTASGDLLQRVNDIAQTLDALEQELRGEEAACDRLDAVIARIQQSLAKNAGATGPTATSPRDESLRQMRERLSELALIIDRELTGRPVAQSTNETANESRDSARLDAVMAQVQPADELNADWFDQPDQFASRVSSHLACLSDVSQALCSRAAVLDEEATDLVTQWDSLRIQQQELAAARQQLNIERVELTLQRDLLLEETQEFNRAVERNYGQTPESVSVGLGDDGALADAFAALDGETIGRSTHDADWSLDEPAGDWTVTKFPTVDTTADSSAIATSQGTNIAHNNAQWQDAPELPEAAAEWRDPEATVEADVRDLQALVQQIESDAVLIGDDLIVEFQSVDESEESAALAQHSVEEFDAVESVAAVEVDAFVEPQDLLTADAQEPALRTNDLEEGHSCPSANGANASALESDFREQQLADLEAHHVDEDGQEWPSSIKCGSEVGGEIADSEDVVVNTHANEVAPSSEVFETDDQIDNDDGTNDGTNDGLSDAGSVTALPQEGISGVRDAAVAELDALLAAYANEVGPDGLDEELSAVLSVSHPAFEKRLSEDELAEPLDEGTLDLASGETWYEGQPLEGESEFETEAPVAEAIDLETPDGAPIEALEAESESFDTETPVVELSAAEAASFESIDPAIQDELVEPLDSNEVLVTTEEGSLLSQLERHPESSHEADKLTELRSQLAELFGIKNAPSEVATPEPVAERPLSERFNSFFTGGNSVDELEQQGALQEPANPVIENSPPNVEAIAPSGNNSSQPESEAKPAAAETSPAAEDDPIRAYMAQLIARNRQSSNNRTEGESTVATASEGASTIKGLSTLASEVLPMSKSSDQDYSWLSEGPKHKQDKDAVRASMQQLRQLANQQARSAVVRAGRKQLKMQVLSKTAGTLLCLGIGAVALLTNLPPIYGYLVCGLGVLVAVDLVMTVMRNWRLLAKQMKLAEELPEDIPDLKADPRTEGRLEQFTKAVIERP